MPNSETASAHTFLSADEASALLDNASDVLLRASNDGDFEWVSQSVVDVLGFTPAQLIGTPVFNLVHPDDVQQLNGYQHGIEAGQPQRFELRLRHSDGTYRWVATYVRPNLDRQGQLIGRTAAWRDINDEVVARERAVQALAHLRAALDTMPDPYAVIAAVRYFDARAARIDADHVGFTWRDVTTQVEHERTRTELLAMAALADERDSVARDLHDGAIQHVYATGMLLHGLLPQVPGDVRVQIERVIDAHDDIIRELRATILGLVRPEIEQLTPSVLFQRVVMEVADNGVGSQPGSSGGHGLSNLTRRAELLDGWFSLAPRMPAGTVAHWEAARHRSHH